MSSGNWVNAITAVSAGGVVVVVAEIILRSARDAVRRIAHFEVSDDWSSFTVTIKRSPGTREKEVKASEADAEDFLRKYVESKEGVIRSRESAPRAEVESD
ncbi:hypothetical protein ACIQPR_43625 [Streptomyces sp. NPDC091280]|uniref:hypothetical protein n=1 Tax=Streptomyces sp. NPDC091280 TaxID=3365984 RepID=UPI003828DA4E